ncbi:MAG: hypothetical protein ACE5JN_12310 [Candidatus Methylomirabilia bacterium]
MFASATTAITCGRPGWTIQWYVGAGLAALLPNPELGVGQDLLLLGRRRPSWTRGLHA